MAGENVLALLDKAPQAYEARPADAFDCALKDFGCTGWSLPRFAVLRGPDGTYVGLCPRREQHRVIAAGDKQAATIIGKLAGIFRSANPGYEIGSKAKTKVVQVTA